jgi:hypothetical protein
MSFRESTLRLISTAACEQGASGGHLSQWGGARTTRSLFRKRTLSPKASSLRSGAAWISTSDGAQKALSIRQAAGDGTRRLASPNYIHSQAKSKSSQLQILDSS